MRVKYIALVSFLILELVRGEPSVETSLGTIKGYLKKSYAGRSYAAFEGIPYAKPPIEDLRFKEPQPSEKWDGVLTANTTYICTQYIPIPPINGPKGTEDCLYLYVYIPRETIDPNANFDVVVHIHGGAFMLGSPKWMSDPLYIMDQDVIYVTFNYRLTIFGFLSTEDDVAPGNNGLKDQVLALRWIKENIKAFGGNPDSITLTGLSAGAASTHFHYLSKKSEGLFHRGLSQSGTALQHWAIIENPLENAQTVASVLNCPIDSNKAMVECFRQKNADDLILATIKLFVFIDAIPYAPFAPVIEKQSDGFLTEHPYKLLKEGKINDVPWINSNVKDEGLMPVGFLHLLRKVEDVESNWTQLMPYCLDIYNTVDKSNQEETCLKIKKQYFDKEPLSKSNIYTAVQMFGDRDFFIDSEKALRLHAEVAKSPVYYYRFSYILEQRFLFPGLQKGVGHCDDSKLMFKALFSPDELKETDTAMMKLLTKFLADYAKTGVPKIGNVEWKPVTPAAQNIDYVNIYSPTEISAETISEFAPQEFWKSLHIKENEELFA